MVSQCRKFSRITLLCFRKVLVTKASWRGGGGGRKRRREGGKERRRGRDGVSGFSVEFVFSRSTETFRGETFIVSKSFGYGKLLGLTGGYHVFLSKICCVLLPKSPLRNPSVFQKSLWIRSGKGREREAVSRFSVGNLLSYTPEKKCRGSFLIFRKILASKKVRHEREGRVSGVSVEFVLFHCTEIFSRGNLWCCFVSENFMQRKKLWIKGEGEGINILRPNFFV